MSDRSNPNPRVDGFDLSALPQTRTVCGSIVSAVFMIVFGLLFSGFFVVISWAIARDTVFGWAVLILTLPGLLSAYHGLKQVFARKTITLSSESVEVLDNGLFAGDQWRADISDFEGVLNDIEYRSSGSGNTATHYAVYVLKLVHSDPTKTIRLSESLSEEGQRRRWEDAARALKLPAIEKQGTQYVKRLPDELDKNLSAQLEEGSIAVDREALSRPPTELRSFERNDSGFEFTYIMPMKPIPYLVVAAFPVGFLFFTFVIKELPLAFGIGGAFFLLVMGLLAVLTKITVIRIVCDGQNVILENIVFGKIMLHETMPLQEVEGINIDHLQNESAQGVVLVSDARKLQVGSGLSDEALLWLQASLLDAAGKLSGKS